MSEAKTSSGVLIFVSCYSQVSLDLLLNKVLAHSCGNLLCSSVTQEPYWCGRGTGYRVGKAFCSMAVTFGVSLRPVLWGTGCRGGRALCSMTVTLAVSLRPCAMYEALGVGEGEHFVVWLLLLKWDCTPVLWGPGCRGGRAFCSMTVTLAVSLCPCAMRHWV